MSNCIVVKTEKVIAAWTPLDWDSKHFGCKMLELKFFIPAADASFQETSLIIEKLLEDWKEFDQVTARINAFDILSAQVVESMGFSLMDTNVRYGIDLRRTLIRKFEGSNIQVDGVSYEIVPLPCRISGLSEIAEVSWSKSRMIPDRFHADGHLPTKLADSVYTDWLENTLMGKFADKMIVARIQGKIIGFLALNAHFDSVGNTCIGQIGLGAVDPSMRGKTVYSNMVSLGLRILKEKVGIVETGTQLSNYGSQRAWIRSGLKPVSATYSFHRWLNSHSQKSL